MSLFEAGSNLPPGVMPTDPHFMGDDGPDTVPCPDCEHPVEADVECCPVCGEGIDDDYRRDQAEDTRGDWA